MLAGVPMSCWSCLWDVRSTSGSGSTGAGAGFMSPHGSPLSPRSCWDRGRTMSRCFLAGPLGAPMPWFSLFPALLLCGTLQWGPKGEFCSLMDAWSTSHCVSQVLPRPGSGCAVQVAPVWVWDALWGAPETVGGSGSDTSEGSEGLTATVPAGAQGSVSTCPQSSLPTMPSSSSLCWPTSAWPPSWTQAYSHEVSLAPAGKSCLLAPFLRGKGDFWVPKGWRGTFLLGSAPHVGCLGLRQCQDSRAGPSLHLGIPGCPRAG